LTVAVESHGLSGLFDRESAKVAKLDDAGLVRVVNGQLL
jgi:hypothetical protein